jgi:hypothetical protein
MGSLVINKDLLTADKAKALVSLCPFGAISYENGNLDISSACKMCKLCVKKSEGIVGKKMLIRILINGLVVGVVMIAQHLYNFLGVSESERASATFTLFILFQLFNAFNSRELGAESIFKSIGKNKVMVITFMGVFALHFTIIQLLGGVFAVSPMSAQSWIKILALSSLIVFVSEGYKLAYRLVTRGVLTKYNLNRQKKVLTSK